MSSEVTAVWWQDWQGALVTARNRGIGPRGMEWLTQRARTDWQDTVDTIRETRGALGDAGALKVFTAWRKWHARYAHEQIARWSADLPTTPELAQARAESEARRVVQTKSRKRQEALAGKIVAALQDVHPRPMRREDLEAAVYPRTGHVRPLVWPVVETLAADNLVAIVPMIDKNAPRGVARGVVLSSATH